MRSVSPTSWQRVPRLLTIALLAVAGASTARAQLPGETPRNFAPGVLTPAPRELRADDTASKHDLLEIATDPALNWEPKLLSSSRTLRAKSKGVWYQRPIWQLDFEFKPLRMMTIDLPQAGGATSQQPIWYLVYRVRNSGEWLVPKPVEGGLYQTTQAPAKPVRFLPHFVLEGHDADASGKKLYRAYLDRVNPAVIEPIRRRETPGVALLDSVAISQEPLPPVAAEDAEAGWVWGIATWEGIDPESDFFSIYVQGLTNAYQWADVPTDRQPGDPPGTGRRFARKTLQLNFWRPGDQFSQHESEVRYGVPPGRGAVYGVGEGVASAWVYR